MGGSGGGGQSTTSAEHSPEMRALQQAALPEIRSMMQLNPLSQYAAWSPRQIAGSNPAYDQLFAQASRIGPALGGLNLIFGEPQIPIGDGGGSMAVPSMGGGTGSMGGQSDTMTTPPPQFDAPNIQDIINQQVAAQVQPAIQTAVNQAAPPRNSVQNGMYYDQYGIPQTWDEASRNPWGPVRTGESYGTRYFIQPDGTFLDV